MSSHSPALQAADPPFGGFLAVPLDTLQHVFLSPGPLYEPSADESAVIDSARDMLAVAGFTAEDVVINTFGYHLIPTGLVVDQVLAQMGATVIPAVSSSVLVADTSSALMPLYFASLLVAAAVTIV